MRDGTRVEFASREEQGELERVNKGRRGCGQEGQCDRQRRQV